MPDALTPAERAAIAAYTGPVQIIPRGVSGLPPEEIGKGIDWRQQIKAGFDFGKMVKAGIERRQAERRASLPPMRERPGEDMGDGVRRMIEDGHKQADIARFYGVSRAAICKQARKA